MAVTPKKKRTRKAPSPNSVLDRRALQAALDDAGVTVKALHIDGFYQALHRQHYPDLPDFVENYYRYDQETKASSSSKEAAEAPEHQPTANKPLKNAISARKNKNRTHFPKAFLDFLHNSPANGLVTVTSRVAHAKTSKDGTTTKLAIELHDKQLVESVIMRYITADGSRASLCVSSQCGCAMGCTFCATGTMGLSGNLTTGEILEQVVHADRILAAEWRERQQAKENAAPSSSQGPSISEPKLDLVRNLVFMGMGEPFDNYTNVVNACKALIDRKRWSFGHGKVTVSTVGLPKQMRQFTSELPSVGMALSLHAPNQAMRSAIVPTAKQFAIEDLIEALDGHMMAQVVVKNDMPTTVIAKDKYTEEQRIQASARRKAMIEYVMLEGDTSSLECAHQLGKLCERRHLVVNLIPYNSTDVADKLHCPSEAHMNEFRRIVSSYGAFCTIRRTMGADIDSACGQLITLQKKKQQQEEEQQKSLSVRDIEDVGRNETGDARTPTFSNMKKQRESMDSRSENTTTDDQKEDDKTTQHARTAATKNDLEQLVLPLAIATATAACCFVISSILFLRQQRRR